ncbi:hypothetical protein VKT23_018517 [Stygiomarasmius scandens]|uniref:Uncharacterized protein n=1 Tax=Marasmiellus scandens TaxID=2682957 RepID=A0ABR1IP00_9AGAR
MIDLKGSISSISVIVSSAALLVTNLTATSLIAYRAWYYRKYIKDHIGSASGSKRVEKILILLVESGSIFCVLWLVALLGSIGLLNEVAETYFTSVLPHAETIYPNIIILLTTLQKTHCDTTLQGQSVSQPLQFASAQQSLMTSRSNYIRNVALGAEIAPNKIYTVQKEGRGEGMEIV